MTSGRDEPGGRRTAARLNHGCFCVTLDRGALERSLRHELDGTGAEHLLAEAHRHLFSNTPVFVPSGDIAAMRRVVRAIGRAASLPGYREAVLAHAPEIARIDPRPGRPAHSWASTSTSATMGRGSSK